MKISVVALGKIGLPLAVQFATKSCSVVGVDVNANTVDLVNKGIEPFPGEYQLQEKLSQVVQSGSLVATTDYSAAIPNSDYVVVVVPLFVDEETWEPDFKWMDSATQSIAENLTSGTTVIYETTLPVGTTRNRWKPMLEEGSGLTEGIDFHVAFSPERVLTGRVFEDLRKYPKLFGALTADGAEKVKDFYERVLDFNERTDLAKPNGIWDLGNPEAAEMAKLAETTYRDVNIALANQFAIFADKQSIDIYKVIEAANSQPFSHIHRPGIAVGGHCIPVYPRLYLSTDPDATVVRAARHANMGMPQYVVDLAQESLGSLQNLKIAILGAAYRGGVKETAFSGVFELVKSLEAAGANVYVHDPLYSAEELSSFGFKPFTYDVPMDVAILQADHANYRELSDKDFPGLKLFIDGRNYVDPTNWSSVEYFAIGKR